MLLKLNLKALPIQELPFVLKKVENNEELQKIIDLRVKCYGHHKPEWVDSLKVPQECDLYDSTINLIAICKQSGMAIGGIRIESNNGSKLSIENDIDIPDDFRSVNFATATKLCILPSGHSNLVKLALFKAMYICMAELNVERIIIAAREGLEIYYQKLMLDYDLYQSNHYRNINVGGVMVPCRIYGMTVDQLTRKWVEKPHPQLEFLVGVYHPDIIL